ncbi:ABC transporter ATP-binding protein [Chengkuizengella sediminis]|uniref:ABC transporter ATP-binding protein n=1 Tax=Chengkuizengella sediminis TaxID=1885917 RepID=UPI0013899E99|nr:dipeptide ABC transporter ATP-binding protein [Chengkuizengella sediminis]NDI33485.1 dipeptide ABC transporter ATP-binding protein [Chengkuizengella sediminis]
MNQPLIEVKNLKKHFQVGRGKVLKAVDGVNFTIQNGETLGMVGESGCGKSTVGRTMLRLYEPTCGEMLVNGENMFSLSSKELKQKRRDMQMIFQDPYASLNPRMTVRDIIAEPLDIHKLSSSKQDRVKRVEELLDLVGLNPDHANRYPHEFSGGQRQRIGIARALAVNPKFIICDEPISALDVSIQAQVVNLLKDLQNKLGLTYLFIAHDLSMVKHISDRVIVMYLGNIVELADSHTLYKDPLHPYTKALMSAIPIPDPDVEEQREGTVLTGDLPSPINPPSGCAFRTRCPIASDKCEEIKPEFQEIKPGHWAACHYTEV